MDDDSRGQSEAELIEQASIRMAKRLNRLFVVDPQKRESFEATQRKAHEQADQAQLPVRQYA